MYAHSSQERETGALTPFLSMTEINSVNRAVVKDFFFRFLLAHGRVRHGRFEAGQGVAR
jgi:hypothetical protein